MNMVVSGIIGSGDDKKAIVRFEDGMAYAEGSVPSCKITSSKGFTDEQLQSLEDYMQEHLLEIKEKAAKINPMRAFLGL